MEIIEPKSWTELIQHLDTLKENHGQKDVGNQTLFRGQRIASWDLETTLERKTQKAFSVLDYMNLIGHCVNEVESLTSKHWNVLDFPEIKKELSKSGNSNFVNFPHYDYVVYLRHHGFPSPLLDWTSSPFIGVFFAYIDGNESTDSALFCMVENEGELMAREVSSPAVHVVGKYVTTHERHFRQKATYTVATRWNKEKGHEFCKYNEIYQDPNSRHLFQKIILPGAMREEVLAKLEEYNVNHYTLFGSEDSLIKTMEHRLFEIDGWGK